jgi:hypothetical protein
MKVKLLIALRSFPLTLIPSPASAGEGGEPSVLTRDPVHSGAVA